MKNILPGFNSNFNISKSELKQLATIKFSNEDAKNGVINSREFVPGGELYYVNAICSEFTEALRKYLKFKNPIEWKKWHGNACRQVAIMNSLILKFLLPSLDIEVKDIIFRNTKNNVKYNHAFIIGRSKNQGLLVVDLERAPINYNIFAFIDTDNENFPQEEGLSYEDEEFIEVMSVIDDSKFEHSVKDVKEYYSKEVTWKVVIKILKELKIKHNDNAEIKGHINDIIQGIERKYK